MSSEKSQDPCFMMYSRDWIEGTAEMRPEEKGIYIDLLCHQHQKKSLPNDTFRLAKLCHISEEEFLKHWDFVKVKFEIDGKGRLHNKKLLSVTDQRIEFSTLKTIRGLFGYAINQVKYSESDRHILRKKFDAKNFLNIEKTLLNDKIEQWISSTLPLPPPHTIPHTPLTPPLLYVNEDGNENAIENENVIISISNNNILSEKDFFEKIPIWTEDIKKGTDFIFTQMVEKTIKDGREIEVQNDWIEGHLTTINRNGFNNRCLTAFRTSLISYLITRTENAQSTFNNGKSTNTNNKSGNSNSGQQKVGRIPISEIDKFINE